jgi:hypothetical protein
MLWSYGWLRFDQWTWSSSATKLGVSHVVKKSRQNLVGHSRDSCSLAQHIFRGSEARTLICKSRVMWHVCFPFFVTFENRDLYPHQGKKFVHETDDIRALLLELITFHGWARYGGDKSCHCGLGTYVDTFTLINVDAGVESTLCAMLLFGLRSAIESQKTQISPPKTQFGEKKMQVSRLTSTARDRNDRRLEEATLDFVRIFRWIRHSIFWNLPVIPSRQGILRPSMERNTTAARELCRIAYGEIWPQHLLHPHWVVLRMAT